MGADYYEQYEECEAFADCLPLGVGKGTHIKGAIVDKNARIGKFCKIVNAEGIQVRRGGTRAPAGREGGRAGREGAAPGLQPSDCP